MSYRNQQIWAWPAEIVGFDYDGSQVLLEFYPLGNNNVLWARADALQDMETALPYINTLHRGFLGAYSHMVSHERY